MRLVIVPLLLVVLLATLAQGKRYSRCSLAREFKCKYGFPSSQIADWVCLVQSESGYNTAAVNANTNGSRDYGLFQINDNFWCKSNSGHSDCGIDCKKLKDNNISDDVKCAKKIYRRHGFNAWYGWKSKCRGKNLSSYIKRCNLNC